MKLCSLLPHQLEALAAVAPSMSCKGKQYIEMTAKRADFPASNQRFIDAFGLRVWKL